MAVVVVCDDVAVVPDSDVVVICWTGVCGGGLELMFLLKEVSLSVLGVRVSPAAMRLRRSLASSRVIITNLHIFPSTASARASRASIPPFKSLGFAQSLWVHPTTFTRKFWTTCSYRRYSKLAFEQPVIATHKISE